MLNALTIDVEDYFQVHAFSNVIRYQDWNKYECRIERNIEKILQILNECKPSNSRNSNNPINPINPINSMNSAELPLTSSEALRPCLVQGEAPLQPQTSESPKATFFVLGWIAERYPRLIKEIHNQDHEIACHGFAHQLIYRQTKEEFRNDIRKAKVILEDIAGEAVVGYRAPMYSITYKSQWAFDMLIEEGFKYDSSIFPVRHDFYGMPNAPRFPFIIPLNGNNNFEFSVLNFELMKSQHSTFKTQNSKFLTQHSKFIIEFPLSTLKLFGQNIPIAGGGYFRFFPYSLVKKALQRINNGEGQPFVFYLHPWEIDPAQPRIGGAGVRSSFRHYKNLNKTENRFKMLLGDFQFSTLRDVITRYCDATALNNPLIH